MQKMMTTSHVFVRVDGEMCCGDIVDDAAAVVVDDSKIQDQ